MPLALECSGKEVDLMSLGAATVHAANRVGILAGRDIGAAMAILEQLECGDEEIDELLRFVFPTITASFESASK